MVGFNKKSHMNVERIEQSQRDAQTQFERQFQLQQLQIQATQLKLENYEATAKKGGLDALTAGRTEGIGSLQKGTTEAGLALGRAAQAATQLETSRTAAEYNRLYHQAQIDAKNAATEIDRKQGIEANRNRARMLLASDKRIIEKLEEAANLSLLGNKQPPEALVKEIAAKKKELDLKELEIATKYDALLYGTGTGTGAGLPPGIKSITPVSR